MYEYMTKRRFLCIDFPCSDEKDLKRQKLTSHSISVDADTYYEELQALNAIYDSGNLQEVYNLPFSSMLITYCKLLVSYYFKSRNNDRTGLDALYQEVYDLTYYYSSYWVFLLMADIAFLNEHYALANNYYIDLQFMAYAHYKRAYSIGYLIGADANDEVRQELMKAIELDNDYNAIIEQDGIKLWK